MLDEVVVESIRYASVHRSHADLHKTPARERFGRTPDSVLLDGKLSLEARAVYGCLARHAFKGGKIYIGQSRIAELLKVSQSTVSRRIKELSDQKHIELREPLMNGKRANYRLTSNVFEPRGARQVTASSKDRKGRPTVRSAARMWAEDVEHREVS